MLPDHPLSSRARSVPASLPPWAARARMCGMPTAPGAAGPPTRPAG